MGVYGYGVITSVRYKVAWLYGCGSLRMKDKKTDYGRQGIGRWKASLRIVKGCLRPDATEKEPQRESPRLRLQPFYPKSVIRT